MKNIPFPARLLLLCLAAAAAAPLLVAFAGAEWRSVLTGRAFAAAIIYSSCIGIPLGFALRVITGRIGKPGGLLALASSAAILSIAIAGSFAGGSILLGLGIFKAGAFWPQFWFAARITTLLGLAFGMGALLYQSMTAQLQEKVLSEERLRKLAAQAQLSSLESRIQPHFLFNTLNSISSLIPVDPERAEAIVGQLARLLRNSLDSSVRNRIPLDSEMRIVQEYLAIEQARFGERLRYRLEVPDETRDLLIPPLSVQALVQNAIKHGIAPVFEGGEIAVIASISLSRLRVEVRDTGPGFDLSSVQTGHGIHNVVSRLEVLFGDAASLQVTRREKLCIVVIDLPAQRAGA